MWRKFSISVLAFIALGKVDAMMENTKLAPLGSQEINPIHNCTNTTYLCQISDVWVKSLPDDACNGLGRLIKEFVLFKGRLMEIKTIGSNIIRAGLLNTYALPHVFNQGNNIAENLLASVESISQNSSEDDIKKGIHTLLTFFSMLDTSNTTGRPVFRFDTMEQLISNRTFQRLHQRTSELMCFWLVQWHKPVMQLQYSVLDPRFQAFVPQFAPLLRDIFTNITNTNNPYTTHRVETVLDFNGNNWNFVLSADLAASPPNTVARSGRLIAVGAGVVGGALITLGGVLLLFKRLPFFKQRN
jgi:hypothetical protein